MHGSLEHLLDQVARRGSWFGGGSVAALSAALSAALMEKLVTRPPLTRRLRRIRTDCLGLIRRDADAFAAVIAESRLALDQRGQGRGRREGFSRALKAATAIPLQIARHAHTLQAIARITARQIHPKFRSDLDCARAMSRAADAGARALIATNVAWLNDAAYTRSVRRQLRAAR